MQTLRRDRWAFLAVAVAVIGCVLFAALASSFGYFEAAWFLPLLAFGLVVFAAGHRRFCPAQPAYVREPFASDLAFRGPPTF